MAHAMIAGIDRIAATKPDTIWHNAETIRKNILFSVVYAGDAEASALQMAAIVFPSDADNDVNRLVPIQTIEGTNIATHYACVSRSGRILSVVSDTFEKVPFSQIVTTWFLSLARAGGVPETLGTYDGGVSMFTSLLVAEPWKVPGDHSEMRPYCNLIASHENGIGMRASFGAFRVVCKNTANMYGDEHRKIEGDAQERARQAWVCIKHSANAIERLQDSVAWITDGRARAEGEKAALARLAAKMITPTEVDGFLAKYISTDGASGRATTIRTNQRDAFLTAARDVTDLGNHAMTGAGISAYGLLQTVTHFEDHVARIVAPDDQVATRRAFRAFKGDRETEKSTAREYIEELVSVR